MGSKSESSHVENIASFKTLIGYCEGFGSDYNPCNDDLSVASMTARCAAVETMHHDYIVGKMATKLPINEKIELIIKLKKTAIRTKDFFEGTKASNSTKDDVKGFVRKITGSNVRRKRNKDGEPIGEWVSNSHLGTPDILNNFHGLLELVKAEPSYDPNIPELTVASLYALYDEVVAANTLVYSVRKVETLLRIARNEGLYMEDTGLVDVSLKCKKYIRALYGARSELAKLVSSFKLTRFMKITK